MPKTNRGILFSCVCVSISGKLYWEKELNTIVMALLLFWFEEIGS